MQKIKMPRLVVNKILHHAQMVETACGLLVETGKHLQCFVYDSPVQLAAALKQTQKIWGIYQAYRQEPTDLKGTLWYELQQNNLIGLMVSLSTKGVLEINAYCRAHDQWQAIEMELTEA